MNLKDMRMKVGFSTVACPEWTLSKVARVAEASGFGAVELRTFGDGSRQSACDPMLSDAGKIRGLFSAAGCEIGCIATGIAFDDPVTPPVIGRVISDAEWMVRDCKAAIDLAASLECPYVRVFGFEIMATERRASAMERILDRLYKSLDHCRHTGVKLVIENGGSFLTGASLREIINTLNHPLLYAAYSPAVATLGDESFANGFDVLGERLAIVKLRDFKNGKPCSLGSGEMPTRAAVAELAARKFNGLVSYELDRAWLPTDFGPELDQVLSESARVIYEWVGGKPNSGMKWSSEIAAEQGEAKAESAATAGGVITAAGGR
jgi:sugar phosphate isomerase/epimerase